LGLLATVVLINVSTTLAQDAEVEPAVPDVETSRPAVPPTPVYEPLTLTQKYAYSFKQIFGPQRLVKISLYAALDQAGLRPTQWGGNADSYAVRVASRFGDSFLRHNIEFGIRALDHEDPRYFRSGRGGAWSRTKYAVEHTFAVRNDNGSLMPAYSLLASDYGLPFLVSRWRPEQFHAADGFERGSIALGIGIASDIFQEFWPDLKRRLPARFSRGRAGVFAGLHH
jgi:hypothetical protein